ncbi:unnamed protein product [Effrenium voratum]|nr:unnamed protein product [Effrenium voratum]
MRINRLFPSPSWMLVKMKVLPNGLGNCNSATQEAVASSISAHLAPVSKTLLDLKQGQMANSEKMQGMEEKTEKMWAEMQEFKEASSSRMDALQAEIVSLQ